MKQFIFIAIALLVASSAKSQVADTLKTDTLKKVIIHDTWSKKKTVQKTNRDTKTYRPVSSGDSINILNVIKIVEKNDEGKVRVGQIGVKSKEDTTKIRIWKRQINIIDGWKTSKIKIERVNSWDDNDNFYGKTKKTFDGHWAGFEMGLNAFVATDYSMYSADKNDFMELYQPKSIAVNLNLLEWNIGLQKNNNTIGLVTGLGLEWNNYRFDKKITIYEDEKGIIQPKEIDKDWSVKKSKLTSLYLNVPLFIEFQIPTNNRHRAHLALGIIGGLRISSHTKIKYKTNGNTHKDKDHDGFNLNTLRCSATARIGYRSLNFFANYGLTKLFENNKGPELTPFTVGITLVSF